jgi:ribonuclease Z
VTLDHRTPVLAFALELRFDLDVRRERLAALGLTPGPWLSDLKARIAAGERETTIVLPNGSIPTVCHLADKILIVRRYQDEPVRVYSEVSARCPRTVVPWHLRRQR